MAQVSPAKTDWNWGIHYLYKGENKPENTQVLEEVIAQCLPRLDITDLLVKVDHWINFSKKAELDGVVRLHLIVETRKKLGF